MRHLKLQPPLAKEIMRSEIARALEARLPAALESSGIPMMLAKGYIPKLAGNLVPALAADLVDRMYAGGAAIFASEDSPVIQGAKNSPFAAQVGPAITQKGTA